MQPSLRSKTDPKQHPVRFLASVWQQQMKERFGMRTQLTAKEYGQLKQLREVLNDLTPYVVEWMVDPVNWWHFSQRVRSDSGSQRAPDYPQIGYLLAHREIALKVMRFRLLASFPDSDVLKKLERRQYEQIRTLVLVAFANGVPERLEKIEKAKTLTEMQMVFIEILNENTGAAS